MQERIDPTKRVTVILDEIGHGRNCFFTVSTFTFEILKLSNQSFPVHLIHIYNELKLNVKYSMHSGEHSFQRKQMFFRDYMYISMVAEVFVVI